MEREKPAVIVSACLLGVNCRYNKKGVLLEGLAELMDRAVLIPVCPEQLGGLSTPRDPAERVNDRVVTVNGNDVTDAYRLGAEQVLALSKLYGCRLAVLKERSPSCGCGLIYDGTYTGTLAAGDGTTSELLKKHGITVYGESKIEMVKDFIADR